MFPPFLGGSRMEESRSGGRRGFPDISRGGKFGGGYIVEGSPFCSVVILYLICPPLFHYRGWAGAALKKVIFVFIHPPRVAAIPELTSPYLYPSLRDCVSAVGGRAPAHEQRPKRKKRKFVRFQVTAARHTAFFYEKN